MFLGYPLFHRDVDYDPQGLQARIVNPSTACDDEWSTALDRGLSKHRPQFSRNRNFVRRVEKCRKDGANDKPIVLIPQPKEGLVYLGRITGRFEIVDDPQWAACYLQLRKAKRLHAAEHDAEKRYEADVAQGWPIADGYHPVPLFRIPGWIRRTLTGRASYGEFKHHHPLDDAITAYRRLDAILNGTNAPFDEWTLCLDDIKWRLVDAMTPNLFEHLVVSLLQSNTRRSLGFTPEVRGTGVSTASVLMFPVEPSPSCRRSTSGTSFTISESSWWKILRFAVTTGPSFSRVGDQLFPKGSNCLISTG